MLRSVVAGLLSCVFAAGVARAETLTIGQLPIGNQPEIVAEALGLHKKYGLDVAVKIFRDGPALIQGLLSGDLQMVEGGTVPMLHLVAQNIPLYFLVSSGLNAPEAPLGAIVIRPDDQSIKSFTDLKGKKLGQLGKGVNTYLWLWDAVAHYGMKRDDFQEIFVPFPQMGGLLASKQVDAVYTWAPFDTLIGHAGQGRVLTVDTPWNPYSAGSAMTVTKAWADKNPETVKKFVEIGIETSRWIDDHPAEARAIIGKKFQMPDDIAQEMRLAYFPRNGYTFMPSIWNFYYLMLKAGELEPFADPEAEMRKYWIDPAQRFIAPALAEMGKQDDPVARDILKIALPDLPKPVSTYYAPWEK